MQLKYLISNAALADLYATIKATPLEAVVEKWHKTWLKGSKSRKVPPMALDELRCHPALIGWFLRWNLPIPVTADDLRSENGKTSPYRGVSWDTNTQNWVARAPAGHGKQNIVYRGSDPRDAARAYDEAVATKRYASGLPYPTNRSLGLLKD